ncbi:MAG: hypothetical protein HLUCCA24_01960 [Rhodobacteraceae bacterium HLUCCA24]|nr:MAG: hypothetical protein HLUCCA24_01960 [Rhodobacteraceae bacterium HLUCCA24]
MSHSFTLHADGSVFIDGERLDRKAWQTTPAARGEADDGHGLSAPEAMAALSATGTLRHLVVGVIGPREARAAETATAEALGAALGALGVTVICGGRSGVMEAVCKGVSAAGGLAIGILPGSSPDEANRFIGIALPTGLGEARNMVIAKSARVLIAVGGSYGTLTEVAYGLHFGKAVIGLEGAPDVEGVQHADSVEEAMALAIDALAAVAVAAGRTASCKISDT